MRPSNQMINRDMRLLRLRQARAAGQPLRLRIISPSDAEKDQYTQLQWSDYWIKYELIKALGQLPDIYLTDFQPHAVLHLFGFPTPLDPRIFTMGWIYGHPDMVTDLELAQYDYLFCYSRLFQKELERRGYKTELLMPATGKLPHVRRELHYPATFVGNARKQGSRPAVEALMASGEPFLIWGRGWESRLPQKVIAGPYLDYANLSEVYASSEFVLNDHHPDMARWGFISFRIFDALASGGFVISDRNPGIEEVFGDTVPQFSDTKELKEIFSFFRSHPEEKERLRREGMRRALAHSWEIRAEQIRWHLLTVSDPSMLFINNAALRSATVGSAAKKRLETVNLSLTKHFQPELTQGTIRLEEVTLGSANLGTERPKIFYVDLFRTDNTNLLFLKALKKVAEVEVFNLWDNLNTLKDRILSFHPDHLHLGAFVRNDMVDVKLLHEIKATLGCTTTAWCQETEFSDYHARLAGVVDRVYLTSQSQVELYESRGMHNVRYTSPFTDPEVWRFHNADKIYDLLFIGNNQSSSRLELLKRLAHRFNLVVAGSMWEDTGLVALPPVYAEQQSSLCAKAKMHLALVTDEKKTLKGYCSTRLVNALASAAFVITSYVPGLEELFENRRHLVWYKTEEELFSLIDYYLRNEDERNRIAIQGQKEVLEKYTFDMAVARILNDIESIRQTGIPNGDMLHQVINIETGQPRLRTNLTIRDEVLVPVVQI